MSRLQELEAEGDQRFWEALRQGSKFFMGQGDVHEALKAVIAVFEREKIPYAVIGAMALNRYGFQRFTTDVDILTTRAGLDRFKAVALGHGYLDKFPGSKGVRDTARNVPIDFVLAGEFPGDGKPKAVVFPDPSTVAVQVGGIRLLPIERLVELKLISGLTGAGRAKDLGDVQELIKAAHLPEDLVEKLDPSAREKYLELWRGAQVKDPISED